MERAQPVIGVVTLMLVALIWAGLLHQVSLMLKLIVAVVRARNLN